MIAFVLPWLVGFMTNDTRKEPWNETDDKDARRLLARLNERAKKPGAGDAPTNFEIDRARSPLPAVDCGPTVGGSRLALRLVADNDNGRDVANRGKSRCEGLTANCNDSHTPNPGEVVTPKDHATVTSRGSEW